MVDPRGALWLSSPTYTYVTYVSEAAIFAARHVYVTGRRGCQRLQTARKRLHPVLKDLNLQH